MTLTELRAQLVSLGIDVVAEDGSLRVRGERGRLTEELQIAIANHKAELLEIYANRPIERAPDVVRVPRNNALPLSFFQERLWILQQLEPTSTAYNLVSCWPIVGAVDYVHLTNAIRDVVRRHEILHSTFREHDGVPCVSVVPDEAVPIEVQSLNGLDEKQQSEVINAAVDAATHTPFDLEAAPPVRFTVYKNGSIGSSILIAAHHIALDAWSMSLLRSEIQTAVARRPNDLAAIPIQPSTLQYLDFSAWQRRIQNPKQIAVELEWWERRLGGIPQLCIFPPDNPRAARNTGSARFFSLDAEFSEALRSMVRAEGATVYMALIAACAIVLKAHTAQDDIVLGSPMGFRERPEFETMIGPFVNLLVLRLDLAEDPTFSQVLRIARDAMLDAHAHREVPFELLVERLRPARMFNHPPLFQVAVVQHNISKESNERIHGGGAIHDVTWFVREVEGRLESTIEFRSDLYTTATIDRIAGHLEAVLRAAVIDRNRKMSETSLLAAEQREKVMSAFNATHVELARDTVAVQFERQAAASPDACAISFDGSELTYMDLNQSANRLARHLRAQGIGRGALVGLCSDRSIDLVVALLAIQKAGAAYVPLDPGLPAERLELMMTDSQVRMLITTGNVVNGFEIPKGVQLYDLAAERSALEGLDASNLSAVAGPQDLAYVIYTSGSLGRPKGVAIAHGALSNLLGSMKNEPGLEASDILAAVTTVSFDIAGLELYLPLIVGARIDLVARQTSTDGLALAAHLSASAATIMQATPVTWRLLVDAGWVGRPGFRALCGGETLSRDLADVLLERVHELWNLYGPTETTIWSTAERVEPGAGPISIGRPIANTQVYICDRVGQPVAIGVAGEIWIGGSGVAIGYHHRPELTEERFLANRFSGESGGRLYRTGDLGRWSDDGRLYHLGRKDHQVKIRGYRIELEEIETVLRTHSAVRQAIVIAKEAGVGDLRLVAYIVYHVGEDLSATEVRQYLRRQLPDVMVPSVIMALDAIPTTPNGKSDRNALPDPFKNVSRATASQEPPAPGMETHIAQIWQRVLKIDGVSAADNFFELGGHSLLAFRVAAAVKKEIGCRMDPRSLFFQNLREISTAIRYSTENSSNYGR